MMLNPIVRREAKTALRGWKIYLVITAYLAIIALVTVAFINSSATYSRYSGFSPENIVYLYIILSGLQLGLVIITTPALTASSISGERERQTLDILLITKMSPFKIVLGKLVSSLSLLTLLIVASMPIYSVLFYYGGVSIFHIICMTLFMIVTAFFIGSVGVYFSTIYKKTMVSIVTVYVICGFLIVGTLISLALFVSLYYYNHDNYSEELVILVSYIVLSLNPLAGFLSVSDVQIGTDNLLNMLNMYGNNNSYYLDMWTVNVVANILVGLLFLKLAAKNINPLRK